LPFEKGQHLPTPQPALHDNSAVLINAVHLKHVLRDIQTDRANLLHGWLLLGGSSNDTANLAHRDAGGGAVHSINNGRFCSPLGMSAVTPKAAVFRDGSGQVW
jgi:hypothetical protein